MVRFFRPRRRVNGESAPSHFEMRRRMHSREYRRERRRMPKGNVPSMYLLASLPSSVPLRTCRRSSSPVLTCRNCGKSDRIFPEIVPFPPPGLPRMRREWDDGRWEDPPPPPSSRARDASDRSRALLSLLGHDAGGIIAAAAAAAGPRPLWRRCPPRRTAVPKFLAGVIIIADGIVGSRRKDWLLISDCYDRFPEQRPLLRGGIVQNEPLANKRQSR